MFGRKARRRNRERWSEIFQRIEETPPGSLYFSLHTSDPGEGLAPKPGVEEVSGEGYTRAAVPRRAVHTHPTPPGWKDLVPGCPSCEIARAALRGMQTFLFLGLPAILVSFGFIVWNLVR